MTEAAVPRYILLAAGAAIPRLAEAGEAPVVGVVEPGHGLRFSGTVPMVEGPGGTLQTLESAVRAGVITLVHAGDASLMRFLFQTWMREHVWKKVVRELARRGRDLREWRLTVVEDALVLSHLRDGVADHHDAAGWWLIVDPDRAAEIARFLTNAIARKSVA